jgi:acyl-CoA synthetase (AMP-forming)/AMP-acid ligase II
LQDVPKALRPERMTIGPACLESLLNYGASFPSMRHAFIGGAPIRIDLLERAKKAYPQTTWHVLYGSTEVEPVAVVDAAESMAASRDKGAFHCIYFGQAVPSLALKREQDSLWVSGEHVAPEYLRATAENEKNKKRDAAGKLWHRMGDDVIIDARGLWYQGRSGQGPELFWQEQAIYRALRHDDAFVHQTATGERTLFAAAPSEQLETIKRDHADLAVVRVKRIVRDRRHRARVDRINSIPRQLRRGLSARAPKSKGA